MKKGFTLVELLAVVAIIAILAAVAIISVSGSTGAAKDAAIQREEQVLNTAYQSYLAAGGTPAPIQYTGNSQAITAARNMCVTLQGTTTLANGDVVGPFLQNNSTSPVPSQMTDSSGNVNPMMLIDNRIGFDYQIGYSYGP